MKTLTTTFVVLSCAAGLYYQPLVTCVMFFGTIIFCLLLRGFGMFAELLGDIASGNWERRR